MATIKEVASRAGVSVATVSRVINGNIYVSPELSQRVHEVMAEMNYQPNELARNLRRQETLTIGVLIPQLDQPFFSSLVSAIEGALFNKGFRTLICSSEENATKESTYVDILIRQRVDGVIVVPTGMGAGIIERLFDRNIPVVIVDRDINYRQADRVLVNNHRGGYLGMKYLLDHGHREIGIIGSPQYSEPMMMRVAGAKEALREYDMTLPDENLFIESMYQFEMGYEAAKKILTRKKRPTAIFALTDVMAIGVFHAATELGLKLPDDLSVLGFDNIPLATYSIPALTTIGQPIHEIGLKATQLLLNRLEDPEQPYIKHLLDIQIIERRSVARL